MSQTKHVIILPSDGGPRIEEVRGNKSFIAQAVAHIEWRAYTPDEGASAPTIYESTRPILPLWLADFRHPDSPEPAYQTLIDQLGHGDLAKELIAVLKERISGHEALIQMAFDRLGARYRLAREYMAEGDPPHVAWIHRGAKE